MTPPTERQVQRAILQMAGTCFREVFLFAVPNGVHLSGNKNYGGVLVGDGVKRGVPDLCALWRGGAAFLEVKRPGGRLSPDQRAIHERLRALGWPVTVVTSVDEAYTYLVKCGAPCSARMLVAA